MGLFKQLVLVAVLCGLGVAAYQYGWPLLAPADEHQAAQGRRGGDRTVTVLVKAVELRAERTRIKAVGTARAYRSVTLYPATAGEVVAVHFAPDQRVQKGSVAAGASTAAARSWRSTLPACAFATRANCFPATNARPAAARMRSRPSPTPAAPSTRPKSRCVRPNWR